MNARFGAKIAHGGAGPDGAQPAAPQTPATPFDGGYTHDLLARRAAARAAAVSARAGGSNLGTELIRPAPPPPLPIAQALTDDQGRPIGAPPPPPPIAQAPTDDQGRPIPVGAPPQTPVQPLPPIAQPPRATIPNVPQPFGDAPPFIPAPLPGQIVVLPPRPQGDITSAVTDKVKASLAKELLVALLLTSPAWITMLVLSLPSKRSQA